MLLAEGAMVLLVRNEVPARSLKEFLDLLKDRPGTLNFSSAGLLSQNYLAAAMLFQRAGLSANVALHVPYPGIAPAVTALITGTVQFMITSTGPAIQHIEAGTLRAIAITGAQRSTRFPNVPTIAEFRLPEFQSDQLGRPGRTRGNAGRHHRPMECRDECFASKRRYTGANREDRL